MPQILTKTCIKCHIEKSFNNFSIVRRNKDELDNICRDCRSACYKAKVNKMDNKQILKLEKVEHKICKMCGVTKRINEFPIDRSLKDGHKTVCNLCNIIRNKRYYQNSLNSKTAYRIKHKLEIREYHRRQLNDIKILVMTYYGNERCACTICGENRLSCLTIDHINGGGTKHRKSINIKTGGGLHFYKWLLRNNYPQGYRTLCWNCQFIVEDEKRKYVLDK